MNWLKQKWQEHGTKLIGGATTLLGMLSLMDATTVHLIEQVLGPHRGHQVSSALLIIGGLGTAYRGFQNSKRVS